MVVARPGKLQVHFLASVSCGGAGNEHHVTSACQKPGGRCSRRRYSAKAIDMSLQGNQPQPSPVPNPVPQMAICLQCKSENPASAKFCGKCGAQMDVTTAVTASDALLQAAHEDDAPPSAEEPAMAGELVLEARAVANETGDVLPPEMPAPTPVQPAPAGQRVAAATGPRPASSTPPRPHRTVRASVRHDIGILGQQLSGRLPGELRLARFATPAIGLTILVAIFTTTGAAVLAVLWALAFVVSVTARMSGTTAQLGRNGPVACSYWALLGLVCAAPGDAAIVGVAIFLLATSARPGREWLPWPQLYKRLVRKRRRRTEKLASSSAFLVPMAALVGTAVLWPIPDVDKGLGWFAGFAALSLILLTLSTAGAIVPATQGAGRVALVSACLAFAAISDLRTALVVATALLTLVVWALEPRSGVQGAPTP